VHFFKNKNMIKDFRIIAIANKIGNIVLRYKGNNPIEAENYILRMDFHDIKVNENGILELYVAGVGHVIGSHGQLIEILTSEIKKHFQGISGVNLIEVKTLNRFVMNGVRG